MYNIVKSQENCNLLKLSFIFLMFLFEKSFFDVKEIQYNDLNVKVLISYVS